MLLIGRGIVDGDGVCAKKWIQAQSIRDAAMDQAANCDAGVKS